MQNSELVKKITRVERRLSWVTVWLREQRRLEPTPELLNTLPGRVSKKYQAVHKELDDICEFLGTPDEQKLEALTYPERFKLWWIPHKIKLLKIEFSELLWGHFWMKEAKAVGIHWYERHLTSHYLLTEDLRRFYKWRFHLKRDDYDFGPEHYGRGDGGVTYTFTFETFGLEDAKPVGENESEKKESSSFCEDEDQTEIFKALEDRTHYIISTLVETLQLLDSLAKRNLSKGPKLRYLGFWLERELELLKIDIGGLDSFVEERLEPPDGYLSTPRILVNSSECWTMGEVEENFFLLEKILREIVQKDDLFTKLSREGEEIHDSLRQQIYVPALAQISIWHRKLVAYLKDFREVENSSDDDSFDEDSFDEDIFEEDIT